MEAGGNGDDDDGVRLGTRTRNLLRQLDACMLVPCLNPTSQKSIALHNLPKEEDQQGSKRRGDIDTPSRSLELDTHTHTYRVSCEGRAVLGCMRLAARLFRGSAVPHREQNSHLALVHLVQSIDHFLQPLGLTVQHRSEPHLAARPPIALAVLAPTPVPEPRKAFSFLLLIGRSRMYSFPTCPNCFPAFNPTRSSPLPARL